MATPRQIHLEDHHLAEALARYGLEPDPKLLSAWHAFTYEVKRDGTARILRLTEGSHRSPAEIEGELEWQQFAIANGVCAPRVIPSIAGKLVEVIETDSAQITVVQFERLDGAAILTADLTPALFEAWGALVGRLHRIAGAFRPSGYRPQWHESDFLNIERYIPDDLPQIKVAARELIATLRSFSRSATSFGMMHADIYQDNFFRSADGLQLFDFDNCEYGFFANDIAIALYGVFFRIGPDEGRQAFAEDFLKAFGRGYAREHRIGQSELEKLPLLLRLRDVLIYTVARKKVDLTKFTPKQAAIFKERGDRIARGLPIVNADGLLGEFHSV